MLPLLLLATGSLGSTIPVNNPSFEILPVDGLPNGCGSGCSYSVELIPGWTNVPFLGLGLTSGQFRPGTDAGNTTYFDSLSDGPTSAYTTSGCISQTLGVTVQEGVTYTLLVDVGWRKDAHPFGLPRLVINDNFYDATGTPVYGGWAPFTVSYVGRPADVGMPIQICLTSVTLQGNFDNVRMTESTASSVDPTMAPSELRLDVRPSPFDSATRVSYSTSAGSALTLRVYDVSGRLVRTLVHGETVGVGSREVSWDGSDDFGVKVDSGIYLIRVSSAEDSRVSRVLLIR